MTDLGYVAASVQEEHAPRSVLRKGTQGLAHLPGILMRISAKGDEQDVDRLFSKRMATFSARSVGLFRSPESGATEA